MIIDFKALNQAIAYIEDVNSMELTEVAKQYGESLGMPIPESMIDEWRFCGLSNEDFIKMISIEQIKAGTIWARESRK
jgi:hypothetical protein